MKQYEAGRSQQRALLYENMSYSVKYTNALKNWRGKKKGKKIHHLRRDQNPNSVNNYEPSNNKEKKNVTNAGQPNSHS